MTDQTQQSVAMNRDSEGLEQASSRQHRPLFGNEEHKVGFDKLERYSNRGIHLAHQQVSTEFILYCWANVPTVG